MNYTKLKAAMSNVGHPVSEGSAWAAADSKQFQDFCRFTLGITGTHEQQAVLTYPSHMKAAWDRIGALAGDVAPVAALIEEPTAVMTLPELEVPVAAPEPMVMSVSPAVQSAPDVVIEEPIQEEEQATDTAEDKAEDDQSAEEQEDQSGE